MINETLKELRFVVDGSREDLKILPGENMTVRMGDKWLRSLVPGERVNLSLREFEGADFEIVAEAEVEYLVYAPFNKLPYDALSVHHGGLCGSELFRKLQSIYGPDFQLDTPVTAVVFRPVRIFRNDILHDKETLCCR